MFSALQSMPDDEAERFLQRIRSADDFRFPALSSSDSEGQGTPASSFATSSASPPSDSSLAATSPKPAPTAAHGITLTVQAPSAPSVTIPPLRAPFWPHAEASAYFFRLALPSAQSTSAGVQSFFNSCGRLFHVFSPLQVEEYYKTVFDVNGRPDFSQKIAICCLCAVAAVGIQYNASDFDKGAEEDFYDVSRHFFAEVIEERPLEAIKICTLFALYNMMNKATAALAYVGG